MKKKPQSKTTKKLMTKLDPSTDPSSTFFLSFVGEYVEIICKGATTTTEIGVFPIVVNGYLLDLDEKHLYLSDDGQSVSRAVKKEDYKTQFCIKSLFLRIKKKGINA